ncbi:uncharacterized protein LOC116804888 [Drosophila mojavensis]|uniref:uncharacterized protein LOC116804888 n=1 Tax=Drosophila mojavensis TaxID=7230 RepID=UPI0013EEC03D|nr:uncharacterized protein LOC116804888 [Drosophila mojavensis]
MEIIEIIIKLIYGASISVAAWKLDSKEKEKALKQLSPSYQKIQIQIQLKAIPLPHRYHMPLPPATGIGIQQSTFVGGQKMEAQQPTQLRPAVSTCSHIKWQSNPHDVQHI